MTNSRPPLESQLTRCPADGVIAMFQVIVVTPERPGTRDCMMWVAMKGGVVAYVRAHWQGTPDEAEAMMLEHLRQGMDALPDMKRRDESWQPMVYAPLDPLVLGNEIRRRVHDAYDLMQVSIGQFHLYFAAAANAEQWMSEFVGLLEKEAIDIWSNIRKNNEGVILHAAAYNLVVSDQPIIAKYRQQAFSIYPWLATYLYPVLPMGWVYQDRHEATLAVGWKHRTGILSCIDQGRKLVPYLSEILNIPQAPLRRSRGLFMTALFKLKHEDFLPLFRSLSNRQGWPFLTREGDVALLGLYYWLDGLGLYGTMGGAVRNLHETPAKLKRDLQLGERWALQDMEYEKDRDFLRFADTVHDYLRALADDAIAAYGVQERHVRMAVNQWIVDEGPQSLIRASDLWHDDMHRVGKKRQWNPETVITWTPLLAEPVQLGQRQIVELSDDYALYEEGSSMKHCVGTFAEQCLKEGSRIFSIRDLEGNRCSTLELSQATNLSFRFGQHHSMRNADPSEACIEAAQLLREIVNSNAYRKTRKNIHKECQQAKNIVVRKHAPGSALACMDPKYRPIGGQVADKPGEITAPFFSASENKG